MVSKPYILHTTFIDTHLKNVFHVRYDVACNTLIISKVVHGRVELFMIGHYVWIHIANDVSIHRGVQRCYKSTLHLLSIIFLVIITTYNILVD
jgi:hypothetical protein